MSYCHSSVPPKPSASGSVQADHVPTSRVDVIYDKKTRTPVKNGTPLKHSSAVALEVSFSSPDGDGALDSSPDAGGALNSSPDDGALDSSPEKEDGIENSGSGSSLSSSPTYPQRVYLQ